MRDDVWRRVWCSIWREPWPEDVRTLALYLLTCEHSTTEGFYRLPLEYGYADLQWPPKRFHAAFKVLRDSEFCEYDEKARVLLIPKALGRNKPNGHQVTAIVKALRSFPPTPLLKRFRSVAGEHSEALAEALDKDLGERLQ